MKCRTPSAQGEGDDSDADNGDEEDEDGFFVPHGYLSEGEGGESDEEEVRICLVSLAEVALLTCRFVDWQMSPEKLKARQAAKARAWELEMGRRCELLRPVCLGCLWWPLQDSGPKENPALEILSRFKVPLGNKAVGLTVHAEYVCMGFYLKSAF